MYKPLDSFQNTYISDNADYSRNGSSVDISSVLGNVISVHSPQSSISVDDLNPVDETSIRFIVNINNEYYTSPSLIDDLIEAQEENNPYFTIDFVTIINIDIDALRSEMEKRKIEEANIDVRGAKLSRVENLDIDNPEDIVKQINWALSPSTGRKSSSYVVDFAKWDVDVDGFTMTYNFSDNPSSDFRSGGSSGSGGSRSGRSRPSKRYTGSDINPSPGEVYPPSDRANSFPNGYTQIAVVFLSTNFEFGIPVDIFLNGTRYPFFNTPTDWDVSMTANGVIQPAKGKIITLDKQQLVSTHFDLAQVRNPNLNLNRNGFGDFNYKILKRNRDADLTKLNNDRNSINYWAGTTDQTGVLQAYSNTQPQNVAGQTSFTFPYFELGKTNMDIGVNAEVVSWNSTGKFVIVIGNVGMQTV